MNVEILEKTTEDIPNENDLRWKKEYRYEKLNEISDIQHDLDSLQEESLNDHEDSIEKAEELEKNIAQKLIKILSSDDNQLHLSLPKKHYASGIIHRINEIIFGESENKLEKLNLAIDEAIGNMNRYDIGHNDIKVSIFYTPDKKVQYLIGEKKDATEIISGEEITKRSQEMPDPMAEHGRGFYFMNDVDHFEARRTPQKKEIEYDINDKKEKKRVSTHTYLIEQNIKQ